MPSVATDCLARARVAAEVVAPLASRIEAERRLPPEALRALVDAGVFKLFVPRQYGGGEASITTALAVFEEIARADGSTGWCGMIGATSGLMSAFVDDDVAGEIYAPADAITCGVFAPMGRATRVDGGFRVSGRWPFASGCEHSSWRMGGTIVAGDPPLSSGAPDVRSMIFPASEARVIDTWDVSGLRGTGSHDIEVKDAFVPASRSYSLITERARHAAPLYALPLFGTIASGVAAVAIGIARGAVDAFVDLAKAKQPVGAKRSIAHRELVQLHVARAEGKIRAARAGLRDAIDEVEAEVRAHGVASLTTRAHFRIASVHAASEAAAAVDLVYEAGGGTSIYTKSPLQRHFRDVHVATQHVMVSATTATLAGRVLLGVETDTSTL